MAVLPPAALAAPASPRQPTLQLPCVLRGRAPLEDTDALPYQPRDSKARHLEARELSRSRRAASSLRGTLEDFLGDAPRRHASRPSRPRLTQRQPIDDTTSVPADVFERMMQLGSEARGRASHTLSFDQSSGQPYLARRDAHSLAPAGASSLAQPPPVLVARMSSCCALEAMPPPVLGHWAASKAIAVQAS